MKDSYSEEEEARLVESGRRKVDLRIFPIALLLYIFSYLDRVNLSNVHNALNHSLGLREWQYSTAVSLFFVTYTLFEIPCNLALQRLRPSAWLSFLGFSFALISTCTIFVTSFAGLCVLRLFLGAAESGYFPGLLFYLSLWYPRNERAFRISIIISGAAVAGAVGGLLAYGILQLRGAVLQPWQWLFVIEGLPGMFLSSFFLFIVPDSPRTATFLRPEERAALLGRLERDRLQGNEPQDDDVEADQKHLIQENDEEKEKEEKEKEEEEEEKMKSLEYKSFASHAIQYPSTLHPDSGPTAPISQKPARSGSALILDVVADPTVLLFALLFLADLVAVYSVSFYLPTIIGEMGFDDLVSNLLTAPIYAFSALSILLSARNSDRLHERAWHVVCLGIFACLGFLLLTLGTHFDAAPASLVGIAVANAAAQSNMPIILSWLSDAVHAPSRFAIASAFVVSCGNLGGIIGPQLYGLSVSRDSQGAPSYIYGHAAVTVDCFLLVLIALLIKYRAYSAAGYEVIARGGDGKEAGLNGKEIISNGSEVFSNTNDIGNASETDRLLGVSAENSER